MNRRGRHWATMVVAGGFLLAGGLTGAAQEATPAGTTHAHPAHIHLGSCDALDPNPTYMLTDVALLPGAAEATGDAAVAIPVERSVTTVDDTLENLATGGYAINIHESVDNIGNYIACGNLTGSIDPDGPLVVGLSELNDSGHAGIAILTANGEQTDVNVYLAEGLSGAAAAMTHDAASSDSEAVADAMAVDIKDLAYNPATVEIPVGTAVTWTNSDAVPHTVTAQDRALLQSGTMDQGATFSQVFSEPGTIDYFCEFHANMKGSIVVV